MSLVDQAVARRNELCWHAAKLGERAAVHAAEHEYSPMAQLARTRQRVCRDNAAAITLDLPYYAMLDEQACRDCCHD